MAESILDKILATKRVEVASAKLERPVTGLLNVARNAPPTRGLAAALRREPGQPVRVLAEIKRASPSAGPIRPGADAATIAREYAAGGAAALSVLTDRDYFDGALEFLAQCRDAVAVPLLRKDFIVDEYQVIEARAAGADGILLIAAALPPRQLADLHAAALELGLDVLVEVHRASEVAATLAAGATLIGVNHRDLATFTLDMSLTSQIAPMLPEDAVLVAESGIRVAADLVLLGTVGAHAVLVGESLMRAASPGQALRQLRGLPEA
ncbi:MAG: indole-3-glycerol phosphate synthase TrpC [Kofleriaceae bacterium]|nr:indole-3-glycerol phosphate synthase TrpC [Kofleriaceae bacterium]